METKEFRVKVVGNSLRADGPNGWPSNDRPVPGGEVSGRISKYNLPKVARLVMCTPTKTVSVVTRLFLETLVRSEEIRSVDYLVVVDSSPLKYTANFVRKFMEEYAGVLIEVDKEVSHSVALDTATLLHAFDGVQHIQFIDNDVEFLRPGLADRLMGDLEAHPNKDVAGSLLPQRMHDHWDAEKVKKGILFRCPPTMEQSFVIKAPVWQEKCERYSAAIRVDMDGDKYYDVWSYMIAEGGISVLDVKYYSEYIHHFGQGTCKRSQDQIKKRNEQLHRRLITEFGVSPEEIHPEH